MSDVLSQRVSLLHGFDQILSLVGRCELFYGGFYKNSYFIQLVL